MSEVRGLVTIVFGSNRFVDSTGIISFEGKEFFRIDDMNLVTTEIRDHNSTLLGKLWKSCSWVYVDADYEGSVQKDPANPDALRRLTLKRKDNGRVIFELSVLDKGLVEINGTFYVEGYPQPIVATENGTTIGTNSVHHNIFDRKKRGIDFDRNGLRLG